MSNIQEYLKELKGIVGELNVLNPKVKELKTRKNELESNIMEYIDYQDGDVPALKFHDLIVVKSESKTHTRLNKKEKQSNIVKLLENRGIQDAIQLYEAIQKAQIGNETTKAKLKIKNNIPEVF